MKNIFVLFLLVGMFYSCSERKAPAIVKDGESVHIQTMDSLIEDTTKVLNVHLPSLVDSAKQILVHEIYLENNNEMKERSYSKKGEYYDSPNMLNLIFEDLINQKKYLLTNNQIRIFSYNQLQDKAGKKYFLYRVIDQDYNKDGKLNSNDVGSLYISNIDGTSFSKLTKERENIEYNDPEWIRSVDRYYFRTFEDSNKDGFFDIKDKMHHYYIQFGSDGYKVIEYSSLEILNK